MRRLVILIVVATMALVAWESQAQAANPAFIYWSNVATQGIGRARLDGTDINQRFITGAHVPTSVAVTDKYVYWANVGTDTIGRATLSGADLNQDLITVTGGVFALAVSGNHVYWASGTDTIGRSNLDGSKPEQSLFTTGDTVRDIAVDADHIYWSSDGVGIGRAKLDGTQVDQTLIAAPTANGVTVDSGHVYWSDQGSNWIGRANRDGSNVTNNFLDTGVTAGPVTVEGGRIYWGSNGTDTIGEAKVDGTGIVKDLVTGIGQGWPLGIAVTSSGLPQASVSPTALDYGTHALFDYGKPKTVTITDTGSAPLAIAKAALSGADARDFLISKDDCSENLLLPGGSCPISVLFGPQAAGNRAATLSVSNDDSIPDVSVALSGTGSATLTGAQTPSDMITCASSRKTVVRIRHHRRHRVRISVATCTGPLVAGMGRFTSARAIVSRGAHVDARGDAKHARGSRIRLVLSNPRGLTSGRYALSLRHRVRGRWVDRGVPIRIEPARPSDVVARRS